MKNKFFYFFIFVLLILIFSIFYKSLNKSNLYEPKSEINKIPEFVTTNFFDKEKINSKNIFDPDKYYLLNIWASWCVPCRKEHPFLLELSANNEIELIGLNYKDKYNNAKNFLNELGNPYSKILIDGDGTIAIEWGAFGVPETFIIYQNKIIKKFIGPLNMDSLEKIKNIIK